MQELIDSAGWTARQYVLAGAAALGAGACGTARGTGRHTMHKPGFCLKYENATKREEFWAELFLRRGYIL